MFARLHYILKFTLYTVLLTSVENDVPRYSALACRRLLSLPDSSSAARSVVQSGRWRFSQSTKPLQHDLRITPSEYIRPNQQLRRYMASSTMKAAVLASGGRLDLKDIDIPKPGPTEILVKVIAAALNPGDCAYLPSFAMNLMTDTRAGCREGGQTFCST